MTLKILIIDDDRLLLRLYAHMLVSRPIRNDRIAYDLADSVSTAQQLVRLNQYDLALIDLNLGPLSMIGFDGLEVVSFIKNTHPHTKSIIMSSQDDDATITTCLSSGADGFVSKNHNFLPTLQQRIADASSIH